MRAIRPILIASVAALAAYLLVFGFVVTKPLTIGFISESYRLKQAYAAKISTPKLVIVAGSNGLFSHRCEAMEPILGMPCLNGAVTAELGLGYIFELSRRQLRRGDVALLPLEYAIYDQRENGITAGLVHPYRMSYERETLATLPPQLIVRAAFQFDLRYLIGAVAEMTLHGIGISRRFSRKTLTPNGDMRGHTEEKGRPYRRYIADSDFWLQRPDEFPISAAARKEIEAFLNWCSRNGIRVIGTLPTTFDDRRVEDEIIGRLRAIYESAGHEFLVPPNRGQYPRRCFYDAQLHLNETCQLRHSRLLAHSLFRALREPGEGPGRPRKELAQ